MSRGLRWRAVGGTLAAAAALAGGFAYAELAEPAWYLRLRYPLRYEQIVVGHARNYGLDGALLAAVIKVESGFDADVVSGAGAIGLMQLLPDTARGIASLTGGDAFELGDLHRPEINVRYGAFYLRRLLRKYGDPELALAAYNAGQANVDRWLADGERIGFPETRAFVDEVLQMRERYRRAYGDRLGGTA